MSETSNGPRIGIVGAGNIASLNVAGYLEDPRCQVVAVCDPVEGRAAAAAEIWGASASYTDLDTMLSDPGIDAVEILTPTNLHYDHVLEALAAGKHVSCQKPLANSIAEARTMADAAEDAGLILRISECYRHYPPLELAKRLIAEGAIGRPSHMHMKTVVGQTDSAFQAGLEADGYVWRLTSASPGGHLFDDVIHKYATALWLFDQDIVSVQAVVRRRDAFFEPCAVVFEYEDPRHPRVDGRHVRPRHVDAQCVLRGRRVLRDPGGRRVPMGDTVHRRDARPSRGGPLPGKTGSTDHDQLPPRGRRLGDRLPAGVEALRRRHRRGSAGRDERRPTPSRRFSSASPSTRRAIPASRSTRAPSPVWSCLTAGRHDRLESSACSRQPLGQP